MHAADPDYRAIAQGTTAQEEAKMAAQVRAGVFNRKLTESEDEQRWQYIIEQKQLLEQIEFSLRGYSYNYQTSKYEKFGAPLVNDKGISVLMPRIRSIISKNSIANNMHIAEIHEICCELNEELCDLLETYAADWNVSAPMMITIINLIDHLTFTALKRSDNGTTIGFLQPIIKWVGSMGQKSSDPVPQGYRLWR